MRRVYSDLNYDFLTIRCVDLNDIKLETDDVKSETEVNKTEANKTEANKTEANKVEANKTEVNKTEVNKTEVNKTEVNKTEANKTEADKTEADKTEANKTEANKTEANKTEANETEANKTEANKTEADKAEADKTEADKTEADKINVEAKKIEINYDNYKTKKFGTVKLQVYRGPYKDNDPFLFLHSEIYNTYFSKNYKVLLDIGLYSAYIFHCSRKFISLLTKALVNYSSIRPFSETFSYYLKRASIECVFGDFRDGLF
jgi:hypothetical protein